MHLWGPMCVYAHVYIYIYKETCSVHMNAYLPFSGLHYSTAISSFSAKGQNFADGL